MSEELSADPRNHVCLVKPVGYELEGLLAILRQELSRAEKGYLVESFWKFLLYTELAKSVYDYLLGKPQYYERTAAESALCEFVEQYQGLISPEFSSRLESAVARLREMAGTPAEGRHLRISELLHDEMLTRLRQLLGEVLKTKARVAVLVDNLDKAWTTSGDLILLSDLLFGLLNVSGRVADEFARNASRFAPVNLSFALFLRSDIYAVMLQYAKERDKLPSKLIIWDDPELLKRVIEQRFMKSAPDLKFPAEVWERYFTPTVAGIPTWEYVNGCILPRPRDLIFLIKAALQFAATRGRGRVEEKDFFDGQMQYSRFALSSLVVEAGARIEQIEDLLSEFFQSPEIISEDELSTRLQAAGIPEAELENVITVLSELTFLAFEVAPNRFDFLHDEQNERKLVAMAKKTAEATTNHKRRFRIHPAFHAFFEITPAKTTAPGQMVIDLK